MRMANRFTPEECKLFKQYTNQPLDAMDLDGKDNYVAPTAMIRKYLKLHQDNPKKYPTPFNFNKLFDICDYIEKENKTKKGTKPNPPKFTKKTQGKIVNHTYIPPNNKTQDHMEPIKEISVNHIHLESLPALTGGIKDKKDQFKGLAILPDSGSEISVMPFALLTQLGYKKDDLNTEAVFQINTVTGKDASLGMIKLEVYLKATNGYFYKIYVNFVIIKQDIKKCLIGYNDLKNCNVVWEIGENNVMTMNVLSPKGSVVRRKFNTLSPSVPLPMNVQMNENWAIFHSYQFPNISSPTLNCNQLDINGQLIPNNVQFQLYSSKIENNMWPYNALFTYHTRVNQPHKENVSGVLTQNQHETKAYSTEELQVLDKAVDPETVFPTFGSIDQKVLDKVSFPTPDMLNLDVKNDNKKNVPSDKSKENKPNIPDCSKLPNQYKKKFESLFKQYEDIFASSQFDIGTVNVPPVEIEHDPNDPVFENPRRYSPDELLVLEDYLEMMLSSGIIEKVSGDTKWNSNLVLVIANPHESKKVRSSLVDSLSKEERLAALKKALRPCLDLRAVNKKLDNPFGTLALPNLEQILPSMRDTLASTSDAKSGYFQLDLHENSRDIFSFKVDGLTYRFRRLAMGWSRSANIFQNTMEQIFNRQAWLKFQQQHPQLKDVSHREAISIYLDDVLLKTKGGYEIHYLVWLFVLIQCRTFNLKLHPHKTTVAAPETEVLGYCVNTMDNTYSLTKERTQYFRTMEPPRSRQHVVSLVCMYQYYRGLIPCLKSLSMFLQLAAKATGTCKFNRLHKLEFYMIRFLLTNHLAMSLPDFNYSLLFCTDSGHTSCASIGWQFIPTKEYKGKPEIASDGWSKEHQKGQEYELNMFGCSSKQFPTTEYLCAIPLKEMFAVIHTLQNFELWIRSTKKRTILFTDAQFLASLVRLKSTSSRLHGYAIYLTSFSNLHLLYTPGRFLTYCVDFLSKSRFGEYILSDYGIPRKVLEHYPQFKLPKNSTISPEVLYEVVTAPLPKQYTDFAHRRKVKFDFLPSPKELDNILEKRTAEHSILNLIFKGHETIDNKDAIFVKETTNKLMSKTELESIAKTHRADELRAIINHINISPQDAFLNVLPKCMTFCEEVLKYVDGVQQYINKEFVQSCKEFLDKKEMNTTEDFTKIVEHYYDSPLLNEGNKVDIKWVDVVLIKQFDTSELEFQQNDENLELRTKNDLVIMKRQSVIINMGFLMHSKTFAQIMIVLPEHLVTHHLPKYFAAKQVFTNLVIFNDSLEDYTIAKDSIVGVISLFHNNVEQKELITILDKDVPCILGNFQEKQSQFIDFVTLFKRSETNVLYTEYDEPSWEESLKEHAKVPKTDVECNAGKFKIKSISDQTTNRALLLSHLLKSGNNISLEFIIGIQKSDPEIRKLYSLMKDGATNGFVLKDGILFKDTDNSEPLMLLDMDTLQFLTENLHITGFHYNPTVTYLHLGQHFYHPRMKQAIQQGYDNCMICTFHAATRKKIYTNVDNTNYKPGFAIHADVIENLPYAGRYKYVLVATDLSTTFTTARAYSVLNTSTAIAFFTEVFSIHAPPKVLKTDYASCFTSVEFENYLANFGVSHDKSCPSRPQNNKSERILKLYRELLEKIVLDAQPKTPVDWHRAIHFSLIVFNNAVPLWQSKNALTRYQLHLSPFFDGSVLYKNHNGLESQATALDIIQNHRKIRRLGYKEAVNPFEPGMVVTYIKNKNEKNSMFGGTGFQLNTANLFRIISVTPISCRCVNLSSRDLRTIDINLLRPLTGTEIIGNLNLIGLKLGTMLVHKYQKGDNKPMFNDIKSYEDVPAINTLLGKNLVENQSIISHDLRNRNIHDQTSSDNLNDNRINLSDQHDSYLVPNLNNSIHQDLSEERVVTRLSEPTTETDRLSEPITETDREGATMPSSIHRTEPTDVVRTLQTNKPPLSIQDYYGNRLVPTLLSHEPTKLSVKLIKTPSNIKNWKPSEKNNKKMYDRYMSEYHPEESSLAPDQSEAVSLPSDQSENVMSTNNQSEALSDNHRVLRSRTKKPTSILKNVLKVTNPKDVPEILINHIKRGKRVTFNKRSSLLTFTRAKQFLFCEPEHFEIETDFSEKNCYFNFRVPFTNTDSSKCLALHNTLKENFASFEKTFIYDEK